MSSIYTFIFVMRYVERNHDFNIGSDVTDAEISEVSGEPAHYQVSYYAASVHDVDTVPGSRSPTGDIAMTSISSA